MTTRRVLLHLLPLVLLAVVVVAAPNTRPWLLPSFGPFDAWWMNMTFDVVVLCGGAFVVGIVAGITLGCRDRKAP